MRIDWVRKNKGDRVVVFFNGWGMDSRIISHLPVACDLVVCSDYRTLEIEGGEIDLSCYQCCYVIAWSMGVWAAANTVGNWKVRPDKWIALNGTECPIDNEWGIPVQSYELTERGMDERGKEKFFSRMFVNKAQYDLFSVNKPLRPLPEQIEELRLIHKLSSEHKKCIKWDKVYISAKDLIFPASNQLAWWQGKTTVIHLSGGHYPFYEFCSWEEIW